MELNAAMKNIISRGAQCIIVTLGSRGCTYLSNTMDQPANIPAIDVVPVDTLVILFKNFTCSLNWVFMNYATLKPRHILKKKPEDFSGTADNRKKT